MFSRYPHNGRRYFWAEPSRFEKYASNWIYRLYNFNVVDLIEEIGHFLSTDHELELAMMVDSDSKRSDVQEDITVL